MSRHPRGGKGDGRGMLTNVLSVPRVRDATSIERGTDMRVHHVAISVRDAETSLRFYRYALGLAVFQDEVIAGPDVETALMERDASVRMVLLADEGGNMIELLEWQSPRAARRPAEHLRFCSTGLVELCLVVSDLDEVGEKLSRHGFGFRSPVWEFGKDSEVYGGGYAKIRYAVDPDGVQVEFMEVVASA